MALILVAVGLLTLIGVTVWLLMGTERFSRLFRETPLEASMVDFRRKKHLLNHSERTFYRRLLQASDDGDAVLVRVRLTDLFDISMVESRAGAAGIERQFVDFLLCDSEFRPYLAFQFERSLNRKRTEGNPDFIPDSFRAAGLPLIRVGPAKNWSLEDLEERIERAKEPSDNVTELPMDRDQPKA